ncbi:MAG: zinc-ribbon domain-containing protein, partial [Herbiconiux sp.]|nr:zinc-ribbon domain-containing protein [Herbiconiux sp.]
MPESVSAWWERRRRSKACDVPYPVGTYRSAWRRYPVLVQQFHPEFNEGRTLSQIPPAADVYLTWQCDVGHVFVATPSEQRDRPGGQRRRSVWCPTCSELATPGRLPLPPREPAVPPEPGAGQAAAADYTTMQPLT